MLTLAFLTIIGILATTSSNLETKSVSAERNYRISFYAAELALQIAEDSIETLLSRRHFSESTTSGHYGQNQQPDWHDINWQNDAIIVSEIPTDFTKHISSLHYTIEQRDYRPDSLTTGIGNPTAVYDFNVLARGRDRSNKTQSLIETIYAKRL